MTMTIDELEALRPRKAVLYLRVSSKKQTETAADIDEDGNSIATQREVCLHKAGELNADVIEEFPEPGVSAKNIEDRPAFKELLAYLEYHREIDYVIVYARSRAFRNLEDAVITERHFKRIGVKLISAREDFGETIQGKAMKNITDTINQMQNELSGEDIRIKLEHKARNGGTVTKAPFGYLNIRKDVGGRMVNTVGIDKQRAPLIREAFELYATGKYTIDRLEATLADRGLTIRPTAVLPERPVSASYLHKTLKDPYYTGYVRHKGEIYSGRHKAIVTQELFDQVQVVMAARSGAGQRDRIYDHVLKGMVFCKKCERRGQTSRIIFTKVKGRGNTFHEYFFCRARQSGDCDLPYIPAYVVEEKVADIYGTLQLDAAFRDDLIGRLTTATEGEHSDLKATRSRLTNELRKIEQKEVRLIDLLTDDTLPLPQIRTKLHELRVQRFRIEDTLANLSEKLATGSAVLRRAIQQTADPKATYVTAPDNVQRLLNEAFFTHFFLDEDGQVSTRLNSPFDDLFAAQQAYRPPVVTTTTLASTWTESSQKTPKTVDFDVLERQFDGNKNGPDFSEPPLFLNLMSVYSNRDSNKATLVGVTGFEPAASSSRTTRATKLRHTPLPQPSRTANLAR